MPGLCAIWGELVKRLGAQGELEHLSSLMARSRKRATPHIKSQAQGVEEEMRHYKGVILNQRGSVVQTAQ